MSEAKIEKLLTDHKDEIKRHFSMVAESLEDKIKIVSEQVGANTEKLFEHDEKFDNIAKILQNHTRQFERIDKRFEQIDNRFSVVDSSLEEIKSELKIIKNRMQQTVDRDEFISLEKRLRVLEKKFNRAFS